MDMIGRAKYRYTMMEYKELTKNIVGDLVKFKLGKENLGVGIVLDHRRYHGEIHVKVAWLSLPSKIIDLYMDKYKISWHCYEKMHFVSRIE